MNKKEFLNFFSGYDKNHISNIFDDIELSRKIECPICTEEFVTPDIYLRLIKIENSLGIYVHSYGVFEESERKILCFSKDKEESISYDIELLKIVNKSKFKSLTHRDYLGSLMALGVKREMFGDLIVRDNSCFVPVCGKIVQYILDNLTTIGRCPCTVEKVDIKVDNIPPVSLDEKVILATSLRIDNMIPGICNLSRTKASEMISSGSVLINYLDCRKKDTLVQINDTITIRGYGKYKVISILGETNKGRNKVIIGKYS